MSAGHALVNPEILSWARERAQLTAEAIAAKIGVKTEKVIAWEAGQAKPTFKQAQHFADKTYVPFGFFFLQKPPREQLPLPDLRTIGAAPLGEPSVALLDTVRAILQKQAWYQEYAQDQGYTALDFVGSFNTRELVANVVADIRRTLKIDELEPENLRWDQYQAALIDAAEQAGVLVMRSGIVGNNTHRPLDVKEFRGFAISDRIAPVIFINSKDAPTARLFTFVHELAHIWIGVSGISSTTTNETREEERFCNAVAGEFLVPADQFNSLWQPLINWQENISKLGSRFHVSSLVVARRALELRKIDNDTYNEFYRRELQSFKDQDKGGGSFYRNAGVKNSLRFSRAVLAETFSGRMLLRDAGRLLGVTPAKLKEYARELNG